MTTIVLIAVSVSVLSLIASLIFAAREIMVKRRLGGLASKAFESSRALEQQITDALLSYGLEPERSGEAAIGEHAVTSMVWELSRTKTSYYVQVRDASFAAKWSEIETETAEEALTWRSIVLPRKSSVIRETEHSKHPTVPGFRELMAA